MIVSNASSTAVCSFACLLARTAQVTHVSLSVEHVSATAAAEHKTSLLCLSTEFWLLNHDHVHVTHKQQALTLGMTSTWLQCSLHAATLVCFADLMLV